MYINACVPSYLDILQRNKGENRELCADGRV